MFMIPMTKPAALLATKRTAMLYAVQLPLLIIITFFSAVGWCSNTLTPSLVPVLLVFNVSPSPSVERWCPHSPACLTAGRNNNGDGGGAVTGGGDGGLRRYRQTCWQTATPFCLYSLPLWCILRWLHCDGCRCWPYYSWRWVSHIVK